MSLIAISWASVSTKAQVDNESIENQHAQNQMTAREIGAKIKYELTVPGESRGEGAGLYTRSDYTSQPEGKGEAYRELESIAESGTAHVIIFRGMDRLARSFEGAIAWCGFLNRAGVAIYDREMPPPTLDPHDQHKDVMSMISRAFGAAKGQREVTEIQRRHAEHMAIRVNRGHFPNALPDGYLYQVETTENGEITKSVIFTQRIHTIKIGFEMTLDGYSTADVEKHFNAIGFTTIKGHKWHENGRGWKAFVTRVWVYAGYVIYNRTTRRKGNKKRPLIRAKGHHPAILTDEQANQIQKIAKEKAQGSRSNSLLSGIVFCACGSKMAANRNQGGYRMYKCPICRRNKSELKIKAAMIAWAKLLTSEVQAEYEEKPEGEDKEIKIKRLNQRIFELENKKARATDLYINDGILTKEQLLERLESIQNEGDTISAEIEQIKGSTHVSLPQRLELAKWITDELPNLLDPQTQAEIMRYNRALKDLKITVLVDVNNGAIETSMEW